MTNHDPKQAHSGGELVKFQTSDSQRRIGNKNAVRHPHLYAVKAGSTSFNRRTSRLAQKVRQALPWLLPTDEPSIRSWSETAIIAAELYAILMSEGIVNEEGKPTSLLTEWRRTLELKLKLEKELGMSPKSRLEMGLVSAQTGAHDLASMIAVEKSKKGGRDAEHTAN
jgi:hypothetical protein